MYGCADDIAASITMDCSHKIVSGFTGRGIYIPRSVSATLTTDASNTRIVTAISLPSGSKAVKIENANTDPFTGTTEAGNVDSGYAEVTKTIAVRFPKRGAKFAKEVLEPLMNDPRGGMLILEKVDEVGDGSFVIYGKDRPAKLDVSSLARDEYANGGAWTGNFITHEHVAENVFYNTDYATTLEDFEDLLTNTY